MNSFDIIGQARLDAVEGQRLMAIATMQWLRAASIKLVDFLGRHLAESKATPW